MTRGLSMFYTYRQLQTISWHPVSPRSASHLCVSNNNVLCEHSYGECDAAIKKMFKFLWQGAKAISLALFNFDVLR